MHKKINQGDNYEEVYDYIKNLTNIRFAKNKQMFPNIEFIPVNETRKAKHFEFTHPQKIKIKDFEFKIPPIEFEILYKEIILASDKDIQDAEHLRKVFSDIINLVKSTKDMHTRPRSSLTVMGRD